MNSNRIIECVPNFSEGRDEKVLAYIEEAIKSVPGVSLLHVDPGKSTNRTVFTFAGEAERVAEAAFRAIKAASEKIDMRQHKGAHPRMGATDVCPLVPISGISMEETSLLAKQLGERVGRELQIPVYFYEESASAPHRKNLAEIRSGEYEGLEEKMNHPDWKPDCGPASFQAKSGATVIGARDFLVAYNVNLNTTSTSLANEIAFDIRENGRPRRDPASGKIMKDENGSALRIPGTCRSVKAIGWYIDEYGFAQVSMNLTNMNQTALHEAFEACCESAAKHGIRVTGSELVGLVPKKVLLDAGLFYLARQKRSSGISEKEIIHIALQSLGLHSIQTFEPEKRIIEYMVDHKSNPLVAMSLTKFALETASESPAPGGGSVSAYAASLGVALGTMVANLTAHKKGYEDQFEYFSQQATKGQFYLQQFLDLVDEDTRAFNAIMDAYRLPKASKEEKMARKIAILQANLYAMKIPFQTLELTSKCVDFLGAMVEKGNPNSVTDAAVGALCLETAARGAALNVLINSKQIEEEDKKADMVQKTYVLEAEIRNKVQMIVGKVFDGLR